MKVTKIHIKNYLNFEDNTEFSLVYPKGHKDAGKPLRKVCFLGQSATCKTSLLNLIKVFSYENLTNQFSINQDLLKNENVGVEFVIEDNNYKFTKWSTDSKVQNGDLKIDLMYKDGNNFTSDQCKEFVTKSLLKEKDKVRLISYPFDLIRTSFDFTKMSSESKDIPSYEKGIQKPENEGKSLIEKTEDYLKREVWDFSSDQIIWLWQIVENQIIAYEPEYSQKVKEWINKSKTDKKNGKNHTKEFEKWEKENISPLKRMASKCINSIIKEFNLKLNTEIDLATKDHRKFIRLKHINDDAEIPYQNTSSGTKQVITTSLPLSILDIGKAIILFDEPETSLYPNTQVGLIKKYTELAPKSQFFFATHSPIVASAFEPWEIIELKFKKDSGKIYQELYYDREKGNSVNSYFVNPQLLNYNDIYTEIFDLIDDGNKEFRNPLLQKLAILMNEFESIPSNKKNLKIRSNKLEKIKDLATKLNIDLRTYAQN